MAPANEIGPSRAGRVEVDLEVDGRLVPRHPSAEVLGAITVTVRGVGGHGVERGVAGERHEVDLGEVERLRLVEPGEGEQVLDEAAHADRLLLDAVHRLRDVVGRLQRAHPVELGVAAHRDERRAQLVRGVADEPAHLVDGAGAVAERAVDAVEHRVERAVEPADLGVGRRAAERWPKSPSAIAAAVRSTSRSGVKVEVTSIRVSSAPTSTTPRPKPRKIVRYTREQALGVLDEIAMMIGAKVPCWSAVHERAHDAAEGRLAVGVGE